MAGDDRPLTKREAQEFTAQIKADDRERLFNYYKDSCTKLIARCRDLEQYSKMNEQVSTDRAAKVRKLEATLEKLERLLAKSGVFNVD